MTILTTHNTIFKNLYKILSNKEEDLAGTIMKVTMNGKCSMVKLLGRSQC